MRSRGVVRGIMRKEGSSHLWKLWEKWPGEEIKQVRVSESWDALKEMLDTMR